MPRVVSMPEPHGRGSWPTRLARNKVLSVGALRCLTASGAGKVTNRRAWRQRVREIELEYRFEDLEALLVALKSRGIELSEPVFQDDQAYVCRVAVRRQQARRLIPPPAHDAGPSPAKRDVRNPG